MSTSSYVVYAKDVNGSPVIPASQRPDGTWRKQRRVKEGYVPQEEVPLYESKGKLLSKTQPKLPVGYTAEVVKPKPIPFINTQLPINKKSPIPGLVVEEDYMKKLKSKKKTKNADQLSEQLSDLTIKPTTKTSSNEVSTDPQKRLRNLKKKLKEIEALELKIKSGEIKKPEQDQLEKVARKRQTLQELDRLEAQLGV